MSDYGCTHPGMPLCRKQSRRSRDAPILELAQHCVVALQRTVVIIDVSAWKGIQEVSGRPEEKKGGTNGVLIRAGRPVTQLMSEP